MRLIGVTVENFRCYRLPTTMTFGDMTAVIGRNDVGKSSFMEALAIFFDPSFADREDACKGGDPKAVRITCEFDQLPDELDVDAGNLTTLSNEYLLSIQKTLVIRKTYDCSLKTAVKLASVDAIAEHPSVDGFNDLLSLKKAELTKRAADLGVNLNGVDKRVNAEVRKAIWDTNANLALAERNIPLDAEGGKDVWTALQAYLPTFALFKSDRASTDQDAEAQDPLKAAIQDALKAFEPQLLAVKTHVETEVRKIALATVEKLREMDPTVAATLDPVINTKKWETLFSTSITGDEGIPLNKRGSGVKRLVLLNFFRAKAESAALEKKATSVIYAIEEPETSQHPRNQRMLLSALRELTVSGGRQVIITTHTPMLARCIDQADLRFIERQNNGERSIRIGSDAVSAEIAASLGVLPDHNVKIFVAVEGGNDIMFLRTIAKMLRAAGEQVPDLETLEINGELIFIPLGGSNLALWSSRLKALNRAEFHLCDRDNQPPADAKYQAHVLAVNARDGCKAVSTNKRELENYLHRDAIIAACASDNVNITLPAQLGDFDDVPEIVAMAVHAASGGNPWAQLKPEVQDRKVSSAKRRLNGAAVAKMTTARLAESDPNGEVRGWLNDIGVMIANAAA